MYIFSPLINFLFALTVRLNQSAPTREGVGSNEDHQRRRSTSLSHGHTSDNLNYENMGLHARTLKMRDMKMQERKVCFRLSCLPNGHHFRVVIVLK